MTKFELLKRRLRKAGTRNPRGLSSFLSPSDEPAGEVDTTMPEPEAEPEIEIEAEAAEAP